MTARSMAPALRERHRTQGGPAHGAREARGPGQVQPFAAHVGQRLLGGGIDESVRTPAPAGPASAQEAGEDAALAHCAIPTWPSTNA